MRICPTCNRQFSDDTQYCPDDGQQLVDPSEDGGRRGNSSDEAAIATADTRRAESVSEDVPTGLGTEPTEPSDVARSTDGSNPTYTEAPPDMTGPASDGGSQPSDNPDNSMETSARNATDTSNLIGERLFGEYEIVDKLGEGGMGAVYLAQQASIDQKIAVKVLHEEAAEDHEMVQRFHREARVVSMLTHPNIIRVFIFGRTPGGLLYLAMEYVEGVPLRDVIDNNQWLDEMRVIKIMKQICSGLSEAHDLGILHRDMKPDNVLLTEWRGEDNFAKILDFGIAKLKQPGSKEEQKKLTQAGIVYGTPEYLSPEQAQALDLDHRTDIYSLGCILYELMTGELPFYADSPVKILTAQVSDEPTPPSQVAPNRVTPTMENIIQKAMAKDPDDRYQDGMEMFEALVAREREIAHEQNVEGPGAYVPGMELTGMHTAIDLEDAEQAAKAAGSADTAPTAKSTNPQSAPPQQAGRATTQNTANPPAETTATSSDEGSDDTVRMVIYLLIAGTALLFVVLVVAIAILLI